MFDFQSAEFSTLGALLIDGSCLELVRPVLPNGEAFGNPACRKAYEAICALADQGKPIDPVTVGRLSGLDNRFLLECMELSPTCVYAGEHAKTVAEGYARRRLRDLGSQLTEQALSTGQDPAELRSRAQSTLDALDTGRSAVPTAAESLYAFLTYRAQVNSGERQIIHTGFPGLDAILGGFAPGGLYIQAARPGVGKSSFAIALGDMLAKDRTVLYASLEMSLEELNARRLAAFAPLNCSYSRLLFSKTTQEEELQLLNTCGELEPRALRLWNPNGLTVPELEQQARHLKAQVVILDYLGLVQTRSTKQTEYERVTQISGDLKRMARRLNCVVLALCQLNRESVSPVCDSLPKLSQLRSSGALEQDADGVLLLHRNAPSDPQDPSQPQPFYINVAKNRHGRTGTVELNWYPPVNRFEDRSGKWPVMSWR